MLLIKAINDELPYAIDTVPYEITEHKYTEVYTSDWLLPLEDVETGYSVSMIFPELPYLVNPKTIEGYNDKEVDVIISGWQNGKTFRETFSGVAYIRIQKFGGNQTLLIQLMDDYRKDKFWYERNWYKI